MKIISHQCLIVLQNDDDFKLSTENFKPAKINFSATKEYVVDNHKVDSIPLHYYEIEESPVEFLNKQLIYFAGPLFRSIKREDLLPAFLEERNNFLSKAKNLLE